MIILLSPIFKTLVETHFRLSPRPLFSTLGDETQWSEVCTIPSIGKEWWPMYEKSDWQKKLKIVNMLRNDIFYWKCLW